jgi:hypothetical protein
MRLIGLGQRTVFMGFNLGTKFLGKLIDIEQLLFLQDESFSSKKDKLFVLIK